MKSSLGIAGQVSRHFENLTMIGFQNRIDM